MLPRLQFIDYLINLNDIKLVLFTELFNFYNINYNSFVVYWLRFYEWNCRVNNVKSPR